MPKRQTPGPNGETAGPSGTETTRRPRVRRRRGARGANPRNTASGANLGRPRSITFSGEQIAFLIQQGALMPGHLAGNRGRPRT